MIHFVVCVPMGKFIMRKKRSLFCMLLLILFDCRAALLHLFIFWIKHLDLTIQFQVWKYECVCTVFFFAFCQMKWVDELFNFNFVLNNLTFAWNTYAVNFRSNVVVNSVFLFKNEDTQNHDLFSISFYFQRCNHVTIQRRSSKK